MDRRVFAVLMAIPLLGGAGVLTLRIARRQPAARVAIEAPLPRLGAVPAFAMKDQRSRPVTDGTLRGKVWVADFIFTSCDGVCPVLTRRMAELDRWIVAQHLEAKVHLLSFSVDPERDTPERLARYAAEYNADASRWLFLTGPPGAVEKAAVDGFKVGVSREPQQGTMDILHGSTFLLLDGSGAIRGYYDTSDGLAKIEHDIERLLETRP